MQNIHFNEPVTSGDANGAVAYLRRTAENDPESKYQVYVSPRRVDNVLSWEVRISGPRGLRNMSLHQRGTRGLIKLT